MNQQRLATVLRVRSLQERIARTEVARRRMALADRRSDEEAAWTSVRRHAETPYSQVSRFVGHRTMLRAGVHDAWAAGERVHDADAEVSVAMSAWRAEARRLDGIERLAERVEAAERSERDRVERNEIDDLVVMRHGARGDDTHHEVGL